jgi:hypothetical protein
MGQADAAVVLLQGADLTPVQPEPWTARLRYAYAEALLDASREDEAREWFSRASEVDPEGLTDAGERLAELDGLTFEEVEEELDDDADVEDGEDGDEEDEDEDEFEDELDDDLGDVHEDEGDEDEHKDEEGAGPDLRFDEEQ